MSEVFRGRETHSDTSDGVDGRPAVIVNLRGQSALLPSAESGISPSPAVNRPARSRYEIPAHQLCSPLQYVCDIPFIVALGVVVALVLRPHTGLIEAIRQHFWSALTVGLIYLLIENTRNDGASTVVSTRVSRVKSVFGLWSLSFTGLLFIYFAIGPRLEPSRLFLVVFYLIGLVVFGLWRAYIPPRVVRLNQRLGMARNDWVVIGDRKSTILREVVDGLATGSNVTPSVVLFDSVCEEAEWHRTQQRVLSDVCKALRTCHNGAVYLCSAGLAPPRLQGLCNSLSILPVATYIIPDNQTAGLVRCKPTIIGNHLALELKRAPLSRWQLAVKRLLDIAAGAAALAILSPVLLTVALAIRLDSDGPILFRQMRTGKSGAPFCIYKFRTMYVMEDGPAVRQACRNDPRVTRVGRFLRASSIDELPQLFNVIKGEMSLVGPRPHALAHDQYYAKLVANYEVRQHVKPGITGWAQINGLRGETSDVETMRQRIEHDIWYALNGTLLLDIEIIARTAIEIFRNRNAY
jgi:Undecaprenyl-phosphate glucose phosphotransferase